MSQAVPVYPPPKRRRSRLLTATVVLWLVLAADVAAVFAFRALNLALISDDPEYYASGGIPTVFSILQIAAFLLAFPLALGAITSLVVFVAVAGSRRLRRRVP